MKIRAKLLGVIVLAAITPLWAQAAPGVQAGQDMHSMPMHKSGTSVSPAAQGVGVIEAIDTTKGTVTIKHHAIASIHWPAMTMTFKADPPSLLEGIRVGEKVRFMLHPAGMDSTVVAIKPVP